jgi:hypothetical protein
MYFCVVLCIICFVAYSVLFVCIPCRGKSPNMGRFPNMGRCIISYQEVMSSLLRNVNRQADKAGPCNHSINGQSLRTSVVNGRLCFGAL